MEQIRITDNAVRLLRRIKLTALFEAEQEYVEFLIGEGMPKAQASERGMEALAEVYSVLKDLLKDTSSSEEF